MEKVDKKILIVEDDNIARDVLDLTLRKYFKEIITADNGQVGLELSKQFKPDLIIADLAMPVLDGFRMLKELQKNLKDTPVIIVTAYREEAMGIEGYTVLYKPVDRSELLGEICRLLEVELIA
ncbi:MAG: response regulator [Denitrovibrio sp.]|nr:MAG: response regulator [Denitrovibrio sp.]